MARKWVTGIVGGPYMVKADAPTAGPPPDKALVYVMRPSGNTFQVNWPRNSFQVWDRDNSSA